MAASYCARAASLFTWQRRPSKRVSPMERPTAHSRLRSVAFREFGTEKTRRRTKERQLTNNTCFFSRLFFVADESDSKCFRGRIGRVVRKCNGTVIEPGVA